MNNWIDAKKELPPDKTWVEAIYIVPNTNITWVGNLFFFKKEWEFHKCRVTHWRFLTHPFFNPIVEKSALLEVK